jgi:hypothetical protein
MAQPYIQTVINCTQSSPVSLKALVCTLFIFFNRAQRVLRSESTLVRSLDLRSISILPLLASAVIHTTLMCPGFVVPTRGGRVQVAFEILHMLLLHSISVLIVVVTLGTYVTTASFLSVLIASHLCLVIKPMQSNRLVQPYGHLIKSVGAYAIPIISWILLPILRVHELEAVFLLFIPELLCFVFAHMMKFTTLILQVAVVSVCSVAGIAGSDNG